MYSQTHGGDLLQQRDTKPNQQKGNVHGAKLEETRHKHPGVQGFHWGSLMEAQGACVTDIH